MKKIAKMPAWQIFLLVIVFPVILQSGVIPMFLSGSIKVVFLYLLAITAISLILTITYITALGVSLNKELPKKVKMNIGFFKFNIGFISIYQLLFLGLISFIILTETVSLFFIVIIPLHIYSMFSILYISYFISKALVSAEKQEEAKFTEYGEVIFLLIFFPIGIWFIQPRVQMIIN